MQGRNPTPSPDLVPLVGNINQESFTGLPFTTREYLEIVDYSARCIKPGKRGSMNETLPPVLSRLGIDGEHFIRFLQKKEKGFSSVMGNSQSLQRAAHQLGRKFLKGKTCACRMFRTAS